MTCEVAILNRMGVALAADSAVTFTQGQRTFATGANKIFQLSTSAPVGVMIYNGAVLHGVPWELILKSFRTELAETTFHSLNQYADALVSYIETNASLFPEELRDERFAELCAIAAKGFLELAPTISPEIRHSEDLALCTLGWNKAVASLRLQIEASEIHNPFSPDDVAAAVEDNSAWLGEQLAVYVHGHEELSHLADVINYEEVAILSIVSVYRKTDSIVGSSYTGVVLAGFGTEDYFPSCVRLKVKGFVLDRLLVQHEQPIVIDHKQNSAIQAFAMKTTVETFLQGVSPGVWSHGIALFEKHAQEGCQRVLAAAGAVMPVNADDILSKSREDFEDEWVRNLLDEHYGPLRQVISSLTVDQMAELAENLVMLESLKEKVTSRTQSVGGPIDVAVITRAEGLVWIKRKLYFAPELNHRYFARHGLSPK